MSRRKATCSNDPCFCDMALRSRGNDDAAIVKGNGASDCYALNVAFDDTECVKFDVNRLGRAVPSIQEDPSDCAGIEVRSNGIYVPEFRRTDDPLGSGRGFNQLVNAIAVPVTVSDIVINTLTVQNPSDIYDAMLFVWYQAGNPNAIIPTGGTFRRTLNIDDGTGTGTRVPQGGVDECSNSGPGTFDTWNNGQISNCRIRRLTPGQQYTMSCSLDFFLSGGATCSSSGFTRLRGFMATMGPT